MGEEYKASLEGIWQVDSEFEAMIHQRSKKIGMKIAEIKENYIKDNLRPPFNKMPWVRIAGLFVVLQENVPPTIGEDIIIRMNMKLAANWRYPKFMQKIIRKIFIRGN